MWEWLSGAAKGIAEGVSNAIAFCVSELIAWMCELADLLVGFIPAFDFGFDSSDGYGVMGTVLAFNDFVPLSEGVLMVFAAITFRMVWPLAWRIISLIPTVG